MTGCAADPCVSLCADVTTRLDGCIGEWGADWEDLGASGARDFRVSCQEDWDAARAELEVRQVPEEEDRCTRAAESLATLSCADLRVLYLSR